MDPVTRLLMQGAAGATGSAVLGVEDVFSTWLYTGNSSTQTITNGIDLSGKGGLVWIKSRSLAQSHFLFDTERGADKALTSNDTAAQSAGWTPNWFTSFNSSGFTLGPNGLQLNSSTGTYASWTFRKAPKFFDVVTYTGNGATNDIAHSLGVAPGFILIKRTDSISDWFAYPRYDDSGNATFPYLYKDLKLNTIDASAGNLGSLASSTILRANSTGGNINGATYVAYLFAHNAGGFGDSGNDSVVSCGSYTGNGSTTGPTVTLGWEPQWLLIKNSSSAFGWAIVDNMRGISYADTLYLQPNTSSLDASWAGPAVVPNANGFSLNTGGGLFNQSGNTYIYIAIRRGPMKTPTDATKVFGLNARTGTGVNATVTGGQVDDAVLIKNRGSAVGDLFAARLTGTGYLETSSTAAEIAAGTTILQANPWDLMDGVKVGTTSTITNASANTFINYLFRRAPGFFDVVTYAGVGSGVAIPHNLGVAPQMIIAKNRGRAGYEFVVWTAFTGTGGALLNGTGTFGSVNMTPTVTASTITYGGIGYEFNFGASDNYIAYLFATCPGVSKVGSYTGTGTTLNVDCGFTAGARFVLIKRTDSTGDWYVWDTARGIIAANDPYLLLNSTAAEVTNTDFIDPLSSGFQISSTAPAAINASGGSFIFLAIA